MRFSRIVSALACAFVLNANAAPVEDYTQYLPDGANLALVVQKIGASAPTIDYHSQQMALPASTQKVLTALAALLQLGPDYRFTTTLESQGDISDGVLRGNLIARFGGDPTFKRQNMRNMVAIEKTGRAKPDQRRCAGRIPRYSPAMTKPPAGHGTT
jgi:serine-type D-Ala-D-Ala carboxypeptidase/endopeptidase (penicillin-binding protein 4)